jgi:MoaA/NifB/PqqE/SkfB family radical SAM enzyme
LGKAPVKSWLRRLFSRNAEGPTRGRRPVDAGPQPAHPQRETQGSLDPGRLAELSPDQIGAIPRAPREAGHLPERAWSLEEVLAGFPPDQLAHLVHALHTSGRLARLPPDHVEPILYALREAGHLRGRAWPLQDILASVPPDQLPHLVHAMHTSGRLAQLSEVQFETVLHAFREVRNLKRDAGVARRPMQVSIDIVGTCNLRCPSCGVGNTGAVNHSGLMDKELFRRIIQKAKREYPIASVYLYRYTEPLLHPELPAFVSIVRGEGLLCGISSNLNNVRNIEAVIAARPTAFRISLSGFTQEIYGQTHVQGDVERVKRNMVALSETIRRQGNTEIGVQVYFHKYRHNLHEREPMRAFVTKLGFQWFENWAFFHPLEKCVELLEGRLPPEQDAFVRRQFALPIRSALEASKAFRNEPCSLLDDLTLDVRGDLGLCCAWYDAGPMRLGHFLDMTPEDVRRAKASHRRCAECTRDGLHKYVMYDHDPALQPIFDGLAEKNLLQPAEVSGRIPLPVC